MTQWKTIEEELLNGQKLQGTLTCREVYMLLSSEKLLYQFPLISAIYNTAFQGLPVEHIVEGILRSKL